MIIVNVKVNDDTLVVVINNLYRMSSVPGVYKWITLLDIKITKTVILGRWNVFLLIMILLSVDV